jgi:nitroreductase
MSELLQGLLQRVSIPANLLQEPAPSTPDLNVILQAAVAAPDHGGLRPWRFIVIQGTDREKLADVFGESARRQNPAISETDLGNARQKALRSPLIIAVAAVVKNHPKIPVHEQIMSAGTTALSILLAANALGYGGIWVTGAFATDPYVLGRLGLAEQDRIVGFVHLGTPSPQAAITKKKAQNRPNPADYTVHWHG